MSIYKLDETYNKVYKIISNAMDSIGEEVELPKISDKEIVAIYNMVISEHINGIFYEPGVIGRIYSGIEVLVGFVFCPELKETANRKIIKKEIERIFLLASKEQSVYNKILVVYRYFIDNYRYTDVDEMGDIGDIDDIKKRYHRMLSPFLYKESFCDGFAYAFSMIMNRLGIPCGVVHGKSKTDRINENHAWNFIQIKDKYYHLDITWDITMKKEGNINLDYFLIDDNMMRKDHYWKKYNIPTCDDATKDYYATKEHGYVRKENDIFNLIMRGLILRKNCIGFRYIGNDAKSIITDEFLGKVFKMAIKQVGLRYKKVTYGYSQKSGTVYYIIDYRNE